MARRRPLVASNGQPVELPTADTLPCNIAYTGTATLPALTIGNLFATVTFTVTPKIAGDVVAAGACITATPGVALANGLNISYAIVTANNTVQIGFTAGIAINAGSVPFTIVEHR